jgi:hypothetical protein
MLVAFASAFKASKPSEGFVAIVRLDKVLSATQPEIARDIVRKCCEGGG